MQVLCLILAVLSVWDYPARWPEHDRLRRQFVEAVRTGETDTMEETCRKGVKLLPDDPTWHYNLACSLAYFGDRQKEAFDELEKAIDLGFRDSKKISSDTDLRLLSQSPRYAELIEYADQMSTKPLMTGPLATVSSTGIFGEMVTLGEQNLGWDFDVGCFVADMKLATAKDGPNVGDLYMNRDGRHSLVVVTNYPGLTPVRLDQEGRRRRLDLANPNIIFPYPAFVNSSMAFTTGPYWRSLSRALVTSEASRMNAMMKMYLSNQTYVVPACADTLPLGTNGDVFASITPYWLTTAGRSWSDRPYLTAAIEASARLPKDTKKEAVRRGLLAPTLQMLIRKSLVGVTDEETYLTAKAHPTALPANGLDRKRLWAAAQALRPTQIPPLAVISAKLQPPKQDCLWPELTYATAFAWAFVLRAEDPERVIDIEAKGAREFRFAVTRGSAAKLTVLSPNTARVAITRAGLSPTNRVDIAVFARAPGTGWGAPSYLSIARMDSAAPYSDPALTTLPEPLSK